MRTNNGDENINDALSPPTYIPSAAAMGEILRTYPLPIAMASTVAFAASCGAVLIKAEAVSMNGYAGIAAASAAGVGGGSCCLITTLTTIWCYKNKIRNDHERQAISGFVAQHGEEADYGTLSVNNS